MKKSNRKILKPVRRHSEACIRVTHLLLLNQASPVWGKITAGYCELSRVHSLPPVSAAALLCLHQLLPRSKLDKVRSVKLTFIPVINTKNLDKEALPYL